MGRKVPGPKPGDERLFIPESFDNRSDPEPIKIYIRNPTEGEKRRIEAIGDDQSIKYNPDGTAVRDEDGCLYVNIEIATIVKKQQELVGAFVVRVENYEAASGDPIGDGESLAEHGDAEVVLETANDIRSPSLSEEDKKKSEKSLDSEKPIEALSNGIATSVSDSECKTTEIATGEQTPDSSTYTED